MGEGSDITELAAKFNTDPGKLRQVQDVAESMGVTPDQFKDMLTKYADAIEKGREELANPFMEPSEATVALKQFMNESDLLKSFTDFMTSLKASKNSNKAMVPDPEHPGQLKETTVSRQVPLSDRAKRIFREASFSGKPVDEGTLKELVESGQARNVSGSEFQKMFEKLVFGAAQTGSAKNFLNSDLEAESKNINSPPIETLTGAIDKMAKIADQRRALEVQNKTNDFVSASGKLDGSTAQAMEAAAARDLKTETDQFESYANLRRGANAVEKVKDLLIEMNAAIVSGLGKFSTFIETIEKTNGHIRRLTGGAKE